MKNYVQWMDEDGFYVRSKWDHEKQDWGKGGKVILEKVQRDILSEAIRFNENGKLAYETVLYSCIKKSGKTAIAASVAAWYAEESEPGTEIYIIANTKEQGVGRVFQDLEFHFKECIKEGRFSDDKKSPSFVNILGARIEMANGSYIQVLSQSFKASAGSRHSLTLWDELWGSVTELDRRLWDEMTPIPTVKNSLRFISTYAGFENESDLLWSLYLAGVGTEEHDKGKGFQIESLKEYPCYKNGNMFTYWDHEPRMPWQTEEYYEAQMQSERPSAFARLHMNKWVSSRETFIPAEWWDSAEKAYTADGQMWSDHPFKFWPLTMGVDAGITQDCTAITLVGYDAQRAKLGLVYHKIWTPSPGQPVDLDAVELRIMELYNSFQVVSIVYDPTHLMQMMSRLKNRGLPVRSFEQNQTNMVMASQLLFDLLRNRNLEAYPSDDLKKHIRMAVAEATPRGFRIVKDKVSKRHHVDGAIALAMSAYDAVSNGGVDISVPVRLVSPFSDMTAIKKQDESYIPFALRN